MGTVIKQGTIVPASCLHEAMGAGGHYGFADDLDIHTHRPGEKDVGAGVGDPAAQSTVPWQEE
ncbi:MAG: hypothetical protein GTO63_06610 [Anaerolineae bacterium]|nr:hypothetical protein [Anaerolineae bacterium]NIN94644.1 hypothetical protein [Anaerolineae bacterium]NIQ77704.1 hypothetical protein [Anaerolineae bacterium]